MTHINAYRLERLLPGPPAKRNHPLTRTLVRITLHKSRSGPVTNFQAAMIFAVGYGTMHIRPNAGPISVFRKVDTCAPASLALTHHCESEETTLVTHCNLNRVLNIVVCFPPPQVSVFLLLERLEVDII